MGLTLEAKQLIVGLLSRNPETRLGFGKGDAEDVKAHPWFAKIDWVAALQRRLKPPKPVIKPIVPNPIAIELFADAGKDKDKIKDWSFVANVHI